MATAPQVPNVAGWPGAWVEESLRAFCDYLPVGSSVLVVGSGDGRDSRYLSSLGLRVASIECSSSRIAEARRHDPTGHYYHFDLRSLAELPVQFDGIHASGCLRYLSRRELATFLDDCAVTLTPRGVLHLSLPVDAGRVDTAPRACERFELLRSRAMPDPEGGTIGDYWLTLPASKVARELPWRRRRPTRSPQA